MCAEKLCVAIRDQTKITRDVLEIWKDGKKIQDDDVVHPGTDVEVRRSPAMPTLAIFKRCDPPLSYDEKIRRLREMKMVLTGFTPAPDCTDCVNVEESIERMRLESTLSFEEKNRRVSEMIKTVITRFIPSKESTDCADDKTMESARKRQRTFSWGRSDPSIHQKMR